MPETKDFFCPLPAAGFYLLTGFLRGSDCGLVGGMDYGTQLESHPAVSPKIRNFAAVGHLKTARSANLPTPSDLM